MPPLIHAASHAAAPGLPSRLSPSRAPASARGFTITEVMFAVLVVALVFAATMSALSLHRIQQKKALHRNIMLDFAEHYMGHVRGIEFEALLPGAPINGLYDGQGGSILIEIPRVSDWTPLAEGSLWENYRVFHPELLQLEHLEPRMRVILNTTLRAGEPYTKQVTLELKWNAPLGRGSEQSARLDIMRVAALR